MFNKLNIYVLVLFNCLILGLYFVDECEATKKILYGLAMASIINAARGPQYGRPFGQSFIGPMFGPMHGGPPPYPYPLMYPYPSFGGGAKKEEVKKEIIAPKVEKKLRPVNCNYHCLQNHNYHHNEIIEVGHGSKLGGGLAYSEGHGGGCPKCHKCRHKKPHIETYALVDAHHGGALY